LLGRAQLKGAVQCYDKALENDPKYVDAWYGNGDALCIMGRCGKVVVDLEDALVLTFLEEALLCFDKALSLIRKTKGFES